MAGKTRPASCVGPYRVRPHFAFRTTVKFARRSQAQGHRGRNDRELQALISRHSAYQLPSKRPQKMAASQHYSSRQLHRLCVCSTNPRGGSTAWEFFSPPVALRISGQFSDMLFDSVAELETIGNARAAYQGRQLPHNVLQCFRLRRQFRRR